VLHHKTFDLGVFTLSGQGVLLVSDQAHGGDGFDHALLRHHGKRAKAPQPEWAPAPAFLGWHGREVFKGAPRHLGAAGGASP
jgi:putative restriction endonuclease